MYTDYKQDESYTASKISFREGTDLYDLHEVRSVDLDEPSGWVRVKLEGKRPGEVLRAHFLQIAIIANHQNGKDTHLRQIKVFGPRRLPLTSMQVPDFESPEYSQFATIR